MRTFRLTMVAVVSAGLLFTSAACGGGSDAAEKLIEKSAGGDVDIEDDSVKVTDEDGNSTEFGTGAALPDEWPDDLKPPEGVEITSASTSTQDGKKTMLVSATADASVDDLVAGLSQQLEDAGYTLGDNSSVETGGGSFAGIEGTGSDFTASVSITGDGSGQSMIVFSLTEV